jgi:hypothetical protein
MVKAKWQEVKEAARGVAARPGKFQGKYSIYMSGSFYWILGHSILLAKVPKVESVSRVIFMDSVSF